jgi:ABC-2 type transport system permease protein
VRRVWIRSKRCATIKPAKRINTAEPVSMIAPAALFLNLRLTHLRNAWTIVRQSALARTIAIIVSCLITWVSLFGFSLFAFSELKNRYNFPLGEGLLELLFDVMFFLLSSLLLFSTAILLYSGLFTAPESRFLLTTPVPDDHIFAYKFQGALAFSNWGFLLLGSPVLIAFGLLVDPPAPWSFFVVLPLFFLGFVLMPGAVGAIVCLLLVNFLPRNMKQLMKVAGGGVGLIVLVTIYRTIRDHSQGFQPTRLWFENFVNQMAILSSDLQPHHWVAAGLRAAALGDTPRVVYYLALVWSNGLGFYVLAVWLSKKLFRRGVERVITGGSLLSGKVGRSRLDRLIERGLFFLDVPTRLLIVKDFRSFRRDPAQWLQIFIFVALLLSYFMAMHNYFERDIASSFKNGISLITVTATSLLMCAYTGRFIFPLLSLEGRTFWLLGLLPLNRARLVWGKFAFSACTCLLPCGFLIVTCDLILGIPIAFLLLHLLTISLVSIGLSGLSVGMGTFMPNFRENDPSKIAVGFGGTLNLVFGFLYILFVIGSVALPFHIFDARRDFGQPGPLPWYVWSIGGFGVLFGLCGGFLPIKAAKRFLERMEF